MYLTITYKNEIPQENLTEGKYESVNELSLSLENKSAGLPDKVKEVIKVPTTSKSVWLAIILIMVVVIIACILILILSKDAKTKKHVSVILIGLLIIPVVAYAAEKLVINVTTKVTIKPVLGCYTFKSDSSGGGGNANMSGLTLMMKNASQGEDDESWFTDTAANQGQAGVYTRKGTMIGQSPFNNSHDNAKYVGYRYDNNGTMTDSNLKTTLDNWYTTNMSAVDSKVETSTYCNDTTTFGIDDYSIFGASEEEVQQFLDTGGMYCCPVYRVFKGLPTTKCKQDSDAYSAKVGFLTVDEEILAGRSWNTGMQDYLYNSSYWWLGSPSGFGEGGAGVFGVGHGYIAGIDGFVNSSRGVRPVVSLSANTSYTGTGTQADPFIVD